MTVEKIAKTFMGRKALVAVCSLFSVAAGYADVLADPLADAVHHLELVPRPTGTCLMFR